MLVRILFMVVHIRLLITSIRFLCLLHCKDCKDWVTTQLFNDSATFWGTEDAMYSGV